MFPCDDEPLSHRTLPLTQYPRLIRDGVHPNPRTLRLFCKTARENLNGDVARYVISNPHRACPRHDHPATPLTPNQPINAHSPPTLNLLLNIECTDQYCDLAELPPPLLITPPRLLQKRSASKAF